MTGLALEYWHQGVRPSCCTRKERWHFGDWRGSWRGALGGVIETTVKAMQALGGQEIKAAIGPCIGVQSYEVYPDFINPFLKQDQNNKRFFSTESNRCSFDLPAYVRHRLQETGVKHVDYTDITHAAPNMTF